VLEQEADREGVPYISPRAEGWFTSSTVHTVIDRATDHPTVQGDEILGRRLADDLRSIRARRTMAPAPAASAALGAAPARSIPIVPGARWALAME
jgi:hypothetical protein